MILSFIKLGVDTRMYLDGAPIKDPADLSLPDIQLTSSASLEQFLQRLTIPHWIPVQFACKNSDKSDKECRVIISVPSTDRATGKPCGAGHRCYWDTPITPVEAIHKVRQQLLELLEHELDEHLCLDNRRIHDPHTGEKLNLDGNDA